MKEFARLLDARGELCPKPILLARQALKSLAPGEVLKIMSTDPQSGKDFEIFCKIKKFMLTQEVIQEYCNDKKFHKDLYIFYIVK